MVGRRESMSEGDYGDEGRARLELTAVIETVGGLHV